ncbi:MAG: hypothetical protein Q9182_003602 [Xanthomendoza sp. 2 TL-2023]
MSGTETIVAPTSPKSPPTWNFDLATPKFHPDISTQRPRAWDRLPKSPFAPGRKGKGKKVWKRYEAPSKASVSGQQNHLEVKDAETSIFHDAKRLRSKEADCGHETSAKQKPWKYITTLRDQVAGTPRRKAARRRSLRPDRLRRGTTSATDPTTVNGVETQEEEPPGGGLENSTNETQLEALDEDEADEVKEDLVQPTGSPLSEDIKEALSLPLASEYVEVDLKCARPSHSLPPAQPDDGDTGVKISTRVPGANDQEDMAEVPSTQKAHSVASPTPAPGQDAKLEVGTLTGLGRDDHHKDAAEYAQAEEALTPGREVGHEVAKRAEPSRLQEHSEQSYEDRQKILSWASAGSRRSLRRNSRQSSESTREAAVGDTAGTPKPMAAVVETEQDKKDIEGCTGSDPPSQEQSVRRVSRRLFKGEQDPAIDGATAESGIIGAIDEAEKNSDVTAPTVDTFTPNQKEDDESTDTMEQTTSSSVSGAALKMSLSIAVDEGSSGLEESDMNGQAILETITSEQPTQGTNMSEARIDLLSDEVKMLDPEGRVNESPPKKTRSGTRFSDDTNMLKDFLSRAQARKLAREVTLTPSSGAARSTSPRRSQRNALAALDSNSPSPHKPRELAHQPGTPPNKATLNGVPREADQESTVEVSPVRRSTRKRLPAPAKTGTGAPSFIPVRRADGTDPVVLQKSVAQELALVTQSNTRRNKGQSKPPAIILKSLPVEVVEEETKGGHALRNCKSVGWDRKLVYYQDGTEAIVEVEHKVEEKRPKARRLRGLGAGNGTPAPKRKTADMLSTSGTPGSKRSGRTR